MKQPYQAKRVPHKAMLRWLKKGFGLAPRHVGIWLLLDAMFLAFNLLLTSIVRLPEASVWLVAPLTLLLGAGTFFFTVALGVGIAAYGDGRINLAELRRISSGVKPFRYVGHLFSGSGKLILIPLLGGLLFTATLAAVRSANFDSGLFAPLGTALVVSVLAPQFLIDMFPKLGTHRYLFDALGLLGWDDNLGVVRKVFDLNTVTLQNYALSIYVFLACWSVWFMNSNLALMIAVLVLPLYCAAEYVAWREIYISEQDSGVAVKPGKTMGPVSASVREPQT